jgi:hypothetical protein
MRDGDAGVGAPARSAAFRRDNYPRPTSADAKRSARSKHHIALWNRVPRALVRSFAGAFLAVKVAACTSTQMGEARTAGVVIGNGDHRSHGASAGHESVMNQAELQQSLQRIASQFQGRVGQVGVDTNTGAGIAQRDLALRQSLLYQSSVLDIASGPEPEVNLLDMVVFAQLCAGTLKSYWTSERLGDASRAFGDAFESLERDVELLADRVLSAEQRAVLQRLIDAWQAENPDQHVVEGVRFVSFGRVAGEAAELRGTQADDLLSGLKSAAQAADRALLLAERALFLSQRVPFLLRTQARLGAREVTGDALILVEDMDSLLQRAAELRSMISETSTLLARVADVSERARTLSYQLEPVLQRAIDLANDDQLEKTLSTADVLSTRALSILSHLERMQQSNAGAWAPLMLEIDAIIRRWIVYLTLAGASCVLLYWVCYYLVKRRAAGD